MLEAYNEILSYLIDQDLIATKSIVASDLAIVDASRRNFNSEIITTDGPRYFIKQGTGENNAGSYATVAYEAKIYQLFRSLLKDAGLEPYLPQYHRYNTTKRILVLEGIADSVGLPEYHALRGRFPLFVAKELGTALARLHAAGEGKTDGIEQYLGGSGRLPWVFFLGQPDLWVYLNSSASNLEFIRIIQGSPDLGQLLLDGRNQWLTSTLIHGDFKWLNCLVSLNPSMRPGARVKIIDWEIAQLGDPCWDVGTFFSEYLSSWLSSVPISPELPPDEFLELAKFPLKKMVPSLRSFWNAYVQSLDLEPREIGNRLLRATSFAGVRLLQTAYEHLQSQSIITSKAICMLQLSANILTRPTEASVQLLGLSLPEGFYGQSQPY